MALKDNDNSTRVSSGGERTDSGDTKKRQRRGSLRKVKVKSRSPLVRRPYPRVTLEEALRIPNALKEKNGGNPWPPRDVASAVGLSHKNSEFFYLAASSRDFGFTEGGRDSGVIALAELGRDIVYAPSEADEKSSLKTALLRIDIFKKVLEYYNGSNLPEMQYLGNTLERNFGLAPSLHEEFSKLFRENCAFLGIGAGFSDDPDDRGASRTNSVAQRDTVVVAEPERQTGLKCFAAMPFRERLAEHPAGFFDEVLKALIAPSGRDAGFEVTTANRDGSDVIQSTIVNHLLDADLVIADLTENNPNVLFELGLRIAEDKPIAIIRAKGTPAIFDVDTMLRVFEYNPNLWSSTVEHDRLRLTEHIKAAWENRKSNQTFMKILRERK